MQEETRDAAAPITPQQRIEVLDVVRGFALLGILLMNIEWFSRPVSELAFGLDADLRGPHYVAGWLVMAFVQGKFYTMFSLLFGMGFVVFLERAQQAGGGVGLFVRRLLVLLVIGVAHGCLLWSGDILATYAVLGLPLLVWRAATPRKLLTSATILFLLPMLLIALMGLGAQAEQHARQQATTGASAPAVSVTPRAQAQDDPVAELRKEAAAAERIYRDGSWFEITRQRSSEFLRQFAYIAFGGPNILAVFLVGAWFARSGVVRDIDAHLRWFRRMAVLGIGLGVPLALFATARVAHANMFDLDANATLGMLVMYVANPILCLGYIGVLVLLWRRQREAAWVRALAAAGRMALSNYLVHSLLLTTLFYAYGFGLWGQIPRAAQVAIAFLLFGAQVILSQWWLARYRYGPMEWLWRCGTYLRLQPLRRAG